MENRDDLFNKMPFYMTYPMQNLYLTEMEYEKDMERMKELYPREVSQLQQMVERRCDEMEYEGSRMYDENPDRMMLEEEANRLYERFLRENPQYDIMMPLPMPRLDGPMDPRPMPRPDGMRPGMPMPRPEDMRPGMPMPRPDDMGPDMPMPRPDGMRPGMPMPRPDGMRPGMPMPRPEDMRPGMPMPRPDGMRPGMPMPRDGMQMQEYVTEDELSAQQNRRRNNNPWLRSLIGILFHDEIYRRRCRHRRCRRWW